MRNRREQQDDSQGTRMFRQVVRSSVPEGMRQDLYRFLMEGSWMQLIISISGHDTIYGQQVSAHAILFHDVELDVVESLLDETASASPREAS